MNVRALALRLGVTKNQDRAVQILNDIKANLPQEKEREKKLVVDTIFNLCTSVVMGLENSDISVEAIPSYSKKILSNLKELTPETPIPKSRAEFDPTVIVGFKRQVESKAKQAKPFITTIPILLMYDHRVSLSRLLDAGLNASYYGSYDLFGDSAIVLERQTVVFLPSNSTMPSFKSSVEMEEITSTQTKYGKGVWLLPVNNTPVYQKVLAGGGNWPNWGLPWS